MKQRIARTALVAALLVLVAGCTTPPKDAYQWGSYEQCVGLLCRGEAALKLPDQIRSLSGDIEKARVSGGKIPPGAHAHLGYLYYLSGNYESAAIEFGLEKELYPEGGVFMDGLLRRMKS